MKNYYLKNADKFGWGPTQTMSTSKIDELLPLVTGNKILDVGCGPGTFVNVLTTRGFEAVGIDITPKFIAFARKNHQGKFLVADATKLPFESKTFDTVFVRSVLEHLDNDIKALREALRVGKKVIIIVPQSTPLALKKRGLIFSHYQDQSHVRYYTPKTISDLVSACQANLVRIQNSEPLPNKSLVYELLSGFSFFKRVAIKILFIFFPAHKYYLELIAIIKP